MYKKIVKWSLFYQLVSILVLTGYVWCGSVSVKWDANIPTPDGYRVFAALSNVNFDYDDPAWEGTAITCILDDLIENVEYKFIVRAFINTEESGDSNVVFCTIEPKPATVIIPKRPFRVIVTFEDEE